MDICSPYGVFEGREGREGTDDGTATHTVWLSGHQEGGGMSLPTP